ncbi:hypothetical protein OE903_16685 [Bacillus sp. B6(2022)]|nr:hypothetical protein [Bacillus sp. B6(2022)]
MVNRKDRLTDKDYKIISDHAGNAENYQQNHTIEVGQHTLTVNDFLKIDHQLYGLTMQQEQSGEFIVAFHCPLPKQMTVTSTQDVQTATQSLLKTDYAYPIERKSLAGKQDHVFLKGRNTSRTSVRSTRMQPSISLDKRLPVLFVLTLRQNSQLSKKPSHSIAQIYGAAWHFPFSKKQ